MRSTRLRVHCWRGLANLWRVQGRYAESRRLLQKALRQAERVLGPSDLTVAAALNELGMLGKYTGRFKQARTAYDRTLRIFKKVLGPEHSWRCWSDHKNWLDTRSLRGISH